MLFRRPEHHLHGRLVGKTEADPLGLYCHCDRCDYSNGVLERSAGEVVIAIKPPLITDNEADDGR